MAKIGQLRACIKVPKLINYEFNLIKSHHFDGQLTKVNNVK